MQIWESSRTPGHSQNCCPHIHQYLKHNAPVVVIQTTMHPFMIPFIIKNTMYPFNNLYFWFKNNLDRTTHSMFDLIRVQTRDLQIMNSIFHVTEITWPSGTIFILKFSKPVSYEKNLGSLSRTQNTLYMQTVFVTKTKALFHQAPIPALTDTFFPSASSAFRGKTISCSTRYQSLHLPARVLPSWSSVHPEK